MSDSGVLRQAWKWAGERSSWRTPVELMAGLRGTRPGVRPYANRASSPFVPCPCGPGLPFSPSVKPSLYFVLQPTNRAPLSLAELYPPWKFPEGFLSVQGRALVTSPPLRFR